MARPRNFDCNKVLYQVMNLFWKKGYEATSLNDILQSTGLSKSSLYETFGTKHELFLSTFKLYHCHHMKVLNELLASGDTALNGIENFLNYILAPTVENKNCLGCMISNEAIELAPHDPEFRQLVENIFFDIEDAFFKSIKLGQTDGSINTLHDARAFSRFLSVNLQGLNVMARAQIDNKTLIDTVEIILKILR